MSSVDITSSISTLLDDIKLHVNTEVFRRHLDKCTRQKLEVWRDGNDFDLLHHAILENNFVVVGTFFALGYFKPPHEVKTSWTYVHVAAVLGQRTIVSMLLQDRPFDNRKVVLDWELFHQIIAPKLDVTKVTASIVPTEEKEKKFAFLPVDLASRYGHVQCVKTILDFHIFHTQQQCRGTSRRESLVKAGHMNMACMLDSPFAVRLLLTDNPEVEDVKNGLDIALKLAKPECVDALLRFGVDTSRIFGGMNLFHVLFTYSKSFEESWFESFTMVTSVLLRHGHDVNACRPSRTYPLYSLLRCTRIANLEKSAPYVMAVLLLLLQAGADPNFDEVFVEEAVRDKEQNTAFGRKPYSSALHCIIDAAVNYTEEILDTENITKYVYKCAELLLRHGVDASYVGKYYDSNNHDVLRRGNALHFLCEVTPDLGRVDSSLLLLLLRHGANPDACINGRYPLTSYIDAVTHGFLHSQDSESTGVCCGTLRSSDRGSDRSLNQRRNASPPATVASNVSEETGDFAVDVKRMCRMVGFMSRSAQHGCAGLLRSKLASFTRANQSRHSSSEVSIGLRLALREIERYTEVVPSLRRSCSSVVWRACRRHIGNVYKLPLPLPLINVVMDHL